MKLNKSTTVVRDFGVSVTAKELVGFLRQIGYRIPDDAKISVAVPGGGDWSNCDLDIDDRTPVNVTWRVVTTENS